jgi:hypothetical protein
MSEAILHRVGEGERQVAGPDTELLIKATGNDIGGTLFMSETTTWARAGAGSPPTAYPEPCSKPRSAGYRAR